MFRKITNRIGFLPSTNTLLNTCQSKLKTTRTNMEKKKIVLFTIITFAISWIAWWSLVFIKKDISWIYQNPLYFFLFIVGGIAPTLAPFLAIKLSDHEFKEFIQSVFNYRVKIYYYLLGIFLILGINCLGIWIYGLYKGTIWSVSLPNFNSLMRLFLMMIVFGGLEELGWRGLLLPVLSKMIKFHLAALGVGVIWAIWHLPLFFMRGAAQYHSDFLEFALQVIGMGFVLAWFYGRTKSIFICALFHAFANAVPSSGLSSPSGNGYVLALIWLVIGLGLVLLDRKYLNRNTTLYEKKSGEKNE